MDVKWQRRRRPQRPPLTFLSELAGGQRERGQMMGDGLRKWECGRMMNQLQPSGSLNKHEITQTARRGKAFFTLLCRTRAITAWESTVTVHKEDELVHLCRTAHPMGAQYKQSLKRHNQELICKKKEGHLALPPCLLNSHLRRVIEWRLRWPSRGVWPIL